MDMGTVGWIALGWFATALVISLALGGFLRKVNEATDEEDLAIAASRQKVMRYMRGRKTTNAASNAVAPRVRELSKRATG
jgi:hypothetical protein